MTMDFGTIVKQRRSIRRYEQTPIPEENLNSWLELIRYIPTGRNEQSLRYRVITTRDLCEKVFRETLWAAAVQPRRTPVWGTSAPLCFVAICAPEPAGQLNYAEAGAAAQTLLLAAVADGFGGCWIGAFQREHVKKLLALDEKQEILYLIALGKPAEAPVAEDLPASGDITYYLDENDCLHVPKRATETLIVRQ